MQLFDFIRVLFEDAKSYSEISTYDKQRNFFMTNRLMSIQYPVQANALNHVRVSQAQAVDYWQRGMTNVYTRVPDWIFAKGQKKAASKQDPKKKPPGKHAIRAYCEATKLSMRDIDDAVELFGDQAYEPIRRLEKVMEQ